MPIYIENRGLNNVVEIPDNVIASQKATITITGSNNKISLSANCRLSGAVIRVGSNSHIQIGNSNVAALIAHCGNNGTIIIGDDCSFTHRTRLLVHEPATVAVGNDCLFASDTLLTASDMHSIIEVKTGLRINPPRDISISDHVWLGLGVTILKGVAIKHGSIVGAGSTVTKNVSAECLVVGFPAKVIRTGVSWRRELMDLVSDSEHRHD